MLDMIEMSYDKIITTRLQANRIVHDFALFARKINLFLVHELYSVNLRQNIKNSPDFEDSSDSISNQQCKMTVK